jgi:hypothetical protein
MGKMVVPYYFEFGWNFLSSSMIDESMICSEKEDDVANSFY